DGTKEVVGAFGLIFPRALAHELREMADKLTEGTHKMASIMQEIASAANEINVNESNLAQSVQEIENISEQINKILNFIKTVADQTKILGINASIEAARAGEHGRGFGVVANEIRNLSDKSKETADQIGKLTNEINTKITLMTKISESSAQQTQEQAAATQEVSAFVFEITDLAGKLAQLAHSI
ncbi:MAG: chemotaxis protein, partial [Syntrophomonadaceae bacterium]|nr:chemotaxis protein [Syntrophomonadaceae bacterium]